MITLNPHEMEELAYTSNNELTQCFTVMHQTHILVCLVSAKTHQLHNYNVQTLLIEVCATFRICTSNNALAFNVYLVGDLLMMH